MEWRASGLVIGTRPHGENHIIATLLTSERGAVSGLVHGGQSARRAPLLQEGNLVIAEWRARSEEALGHFTIELEEPYAAAALHSRTAALGLVAITDLLRTVLAEGEAAPTLFAGTKAVLGHLTDDELFAVLFAKWELGVLTAMGFGLTLDRCVASGALAEDGAHLAYVSPKSGGAVTAEAGAPWKDRLMPLPPFLIDRGEPSWPDVLAALRLTGHFLSENLLAPASKNLPEARDRLISRWARNGQGM